MRNTILITSLVVPALLAVPHRATAQQAQTPGKLATLFEDVFGPTGLVVNSEAVLPDGTTHSAHFNSAFQSNFTQFNVALVSQLTALPLPSPASGFTYAFDSATGTFRRTTRSFGPILSERADTIGKGRLSVGFNYQYSLSTRSTVWTCPPCPRCSPTTIGNSAAAVWTSSPRRTRSKRRLHSGPARSRTGLTDRIDVSLALPVVRTTLSVLSNAQIQRIGTVDPAVHFFEDPTARGGFGDRKQFSGQGSASGVGDMIVRVKANGFREGSRALAVGLDLRLPTGDEKDLLGSGAFGVKPFAALSSSFGRLSPRANIAWQWNGQSVLANDVRQNLKGDLPDQLLYVLGTDVGVNDRVSLAIDLLGQHVFDTPLLSARPFVANSAGLTFDDITFRTGSIDAVAGSAGMKVNVAPHLLVNFNLRFHIAGGGLKDRLTPLIGLEFGS